MKMVIDIEEKIFEELTKYNEPVPSGNRLYDSVLLSIYNGTPLPEHHGRLIDADNLKHELIDKEWITDYDGDGLEDIVNEAPTIIEKE